MQEKKRKETGADGSLAEALLPINDGISEPAPRPESTKRPRLPTRGSPSQIATPSMHTRSTHTQDAEDSDNDLHRHPSPPTLTATDETREEGRVSAAKVSSMLRDDDVILQRISTTSNVSTTAHDVSLRPRNVTSRNRGTRRSLSSDAIRDRWQMSGRQFWPRSRQQSPARDLFLRGHNASTVLDFRDDVRHRYIPSANDWDELHDRPNSPPEQINFPRCQSLEVNVMEELENKMDTGNSLAALRTTLANERTFLAWIRTGAALIACGLAVDKALENERGVAIMFIVTGFFTGIQGVIRFYQVRKRLDTLVFRTEGRMDIGRVGMKWFVLFVVVSISISVAYLAIRLMMLPRPKSVA
eukprot:GEMP01025670.1.p1 GENE.GEMP01025670.1~~GEMP01025670.1.p1  ORF type:complete len:357 (+),score=70.68 GEMP01025670.1:175-1245(+)